MQNNSNNSNAESLFGCGSFSTIQKSLLNSNDINNAAKIKSDHHKSDDHLNKNDYYSAAKRHGVKAGSASNNNNNNNMNESSDDELNDQYNDMDELEDDEDYDDYDDDEHADNTSYNQSEYLDDYDNKMSNNNNSNNNQYSNIASESANDPNNNSHVYNKNTDSKYANENSSSSSFAQNNAKKTKGELICVVCGASANGYNFDAITCESCKAFFRRNAFRPINLFRCSNNNSCTITIATRKKCKRCRIMKCFSLGMRRDWIMTEVEREEKRRKIEENRKKKHLNTNGTDSSQETPYNTARSHSGNAQYNSENEYPGQSSISKPIRRRRRRRRQGAPPSGDAKNCDTVVQKHSITSGQVAAASHLLLASSSELSKLPPPQPAPPTMPPNTHHPGAAAAADKLAYSSAAHSFVDMRKQLVQPELGNVVMPSSSSNLFSPKMIKSELDATGGLSSVQYAKPYSQSKSHHQQHHHPLHQTPEFLLYSSGKPNPNQNNIPSTHAHLQHHPYSPHGLYSNAYPPDHHFALDTSNNPFDQQLNSIKKQPMFHQNPFNQNQTDNLYSSKLAPPTTYDESRKSSPYGNPTYYNESSNKKPVEVENASEFNWKKKKRSSPVRNPTLEETPAAAVAALSPTCTIESTSSSSPNLMTNVSPTPSSTSILEALKLATSDKVSLKNLELKTKMADLERSQVKAILEAYRQGIKLVKAQCTPPNSEDINTTINLTELGVRRIIFFFKLISDFRNLEHDIMVKLLKQNMMNLIQIHGVNSYNRAENTFKEPDTDDTPFSATSLEAVYGPEIYKLSISSTQNLYDLCNGDMTYIKILMLIILFDPTNETLTAEEKTLVTNLQNKYVTLIYAYMCENFGANKASLIFKSIIYETNKINDLANWFEKTVVEKSDYEYVRPLMKEVFSFPNDNTPPSSVNSSASSSSANPLSSASSSHISTESTTLSTHTNNPSSASSTSNTSNKTQTYRNSNEPLLHT